MPIKALYRQLRKAKQFANKVGETIKDSVLVRSGYNNTEDTGLFTNVYYEWSMCPQTDKSGKDF